MYNKCSTCAPKASNCGPRIQWYLKKVGFCSSCRSSQYVLDVILHLYMGLWNEVKPYDRPSSSFKSLNAMCKYLMQGIYHAQLTVGHIRFLTCLSHVSTVHHSKSHKKSYLRISCEEFGGLGLLLLLFFVTASRNLPPGATLQREDFLWLRCQV